MREPPNKAPAVFAFRPPFPHRWGRAGRSSASLVCSAGAALRHAPNTAVCESPAQFGPHLLVPLPIMYFIFPARAWGWRAFGGGVGRLGVRGSGLAEGPWRGELRFGDRQRAGQRKAGGCDGDWGSWGVSAGQRRSSPVNAGQTAHLADQRGHHDGVPLPEDAAGPQRARGQVGPVGLGVWVWVWDWVWAWAAACALFRVTEDRLSCLCLCAWVWGFGVSSRWVSGWLLSGRGAHAGPGQARPHATGPRTARAAKPAGAPEPPGPARLQGHPLPRDFGGGVVIHRAGRVGQRLVRVNEVLALKHDWGVVGARGFEFYAALGLRGLGG